MFDAEDILSLRGIGDPVADEVVLAEIRGDATHAAAGILTALTNSLRDLDDSPTVAGWVNRVEAAPPWIDNEMVAQGQDVFTEWSLDIVTALFCASLPFAYAAAKGVEVLERISLLADPKTVARRIAETGQMLLDVSEPGALAPGGCGHRTARTVRLLHAVIRARLTMTRPSSPADHSSAGWDSAVWGVPVNQEDLLGTLLSFTSVVFRAFDHMGIPLTHEAQESYLQLWAAIGDLLGIASAEFVVRPADAEVLTDLIAEQLHAPSRAGVHLMGVLMDEMELSIAVGPAETASDSGASPRRRRGGRHPGRQVEPLVGRPPSGAGRIEPGHGAFPLRPGSLAGAISDARAFDDPDVDRPE